MVSRVLFYGSLLLISDLVVLFLLLHFRVALAAVLLGAIAFPFLALVPLVQFAPRHCMICRRRTRRDVPFLQRFREFFWINGEGPRCSLHAI